MWVTSPTETRFLLGIIIHKCLGVKRKLSQLCVPSTPPHLLPAGAGQRCTASALQRMPVASNHATCTASNHATCTAVGRSTAEQRSATIALP